MRILLIEPYYEGSHKYWADNIVKYSSYNIQLQTMEGRFWKWRMQGASIYLASLFNKLSQEPDLIICSSMMDVSTYKSLIDSNTSQEIPIIYYCHETQFTYPFSTKDERENENFHYGFINYKSCLAADRVLFNTDYHKSCFISALSSLLSRLPDYSLQDTIAELESKSYTSYVGIDMQKISRISGSHDRIQTPTLLWNNRWDEDKNPYLFLQLCKFLKKQNIEFKMVLTGKPGNASECSTLLHKEFSSNIIHSGYIDSYEKYISLLRICDVLPVCAAHDFYGISFLEAVINNVLPIMPHGKVYAEFVSVENFSNLYYYSESEFFRKVKENLNEKISFKLNSQSIHKTIKTFDLHIKETYNLYRQKL